MIPSFFPKFPGLEQFLLRFHSCKVPISYTHCLLCTVHCPPISLASPAVQGPLDALEGDSFAGGGVHVDEHAEEEDRAGGDFVGAGDAGEEAFEGDFGFHADDGVGGSDHAHVGDKGGAAGQDALVGGGDVGVGAEHGADFAVEVNGQGFFLGGGFGVEVNDLHAHVGPEVFQFLFRGAEGAVHRGHEDAAGEVEEGDRAVAGVEDDDAAAGGAGREVGGPEQVVQLSQLGDQVFFIPDVVAGGEHVNAQAEEFVVDVQGQAETAGRVFDVDRDQVHVVALDQFGQEAGQGAPSGLADHVAEEEQVHSGFSFIRNRTIEERHQDTKEREKKEKR